MTRRWHSVLMVALLLAVPASLARAAAEPDLDGTYLSKGLNPDGSEYEGVVRITRNGDSFVVSWMSAYASDRATMLVPTSVGVGVLSGGMFAVSYYSPQSAGVALYRVEKDGQRLAGSWAVAGDKGDVYTETLTKVSESEALRALPAPSPTERPHPRAPTRPRPRPGDREI